MENKILSLTSFLKVIVVLAVFSTTNGIMLFLLTLRGNLLSTNLKADVTRAAKRLKEIYEDIRAISPEENCPMVGVRVWVRVRVSFRVGDNVPRGQMS